MLDLIEWLREHNAAVSADQRVRFVGVDPQRPERAVDGVRMFLSRHAPDEAERFNDTLDVLHTIRRPPMPPLPETVRDDIAALRDVVGQVVHDYWGERVDIERHLQHLIRSAELATAPFDRAGPQNYYAVRDRLMADAVIEAATSVGDEPGPRVALWAHNGHVSCGAPSSESRPIGAHLRARFGAKYYAMALLQGGGVFHARRKRLIGGLTTDPVSFRTAPAPARTT